MRHGEFGKCAFESRNGVDGLEPEGSESHDWQPGGAVEMMQSLKTGDERQDLPLTTRFVGLQ